MSIENSEGVNKDNCDGANRSYGVNRSDGVNWSDGVNRSYGVNWSDGVINSYGVDKSIFCANKPRAFSLFQKEVSEERFDEVWRQIHSLTDGWFPKFNNAFELYLKNGSDWSRVDVSEITSTLSEWEKPHEAWKDMPKPLLEYIQSLPEFDAGIFMRVTGIDVNTNKECCHASKDYKYCPNCGYKL